uniref:5-formyltetrahydrofolate cyclo-ligase n=1 Tax=Rhodosorus marinus TaxID=101924 RepID=A0A7S2ZXC2_9RHOD|mmetsp:Transcript_33937/g.133148  ORF Transcript_33937/g.133148 Transcript_33937/m.133148 type:complete len:211 (+) Transcript_33937:645-1277(+)|eukprot:CAMPEP_0113968810 /NCGR_PEP_ID=MMETSP0011_2-20120614/9790_1 /TAXON_ID=101924 /ORGANISM="Rhodosorus marinus" /LENGTH=210 /DNA_ID=CAMNT_0000982041 /DNA_START=520 /DNA_END=1152 /DNA_ORIENTATION=+ /assembly_acc=CAM_ASM_000156
MEGRSLEALRLAKGELRKEIKQRLKSLSKLEISEQSSAVIRSLVSAPIFTQARSVTAYLSMEKEFCTDDLVSALFEHSKRVYFPVVTDAKTSSMLMLEATSMNDLRSWRRSNWGIPEPPTDDPKRRNALDDNDLDLIIVPGVAFDSRGGRLGHGKGFYDRFLQRCRERRQAQSLPMPKTVALSLREQMVVEVPMSADDVFLDQIEYQTES